MPSPDFAQIGIIVIWLAKSVTENNAVIKRLLIPKGIIPLFPPLGLLSTVQKGQEVGEDVSDD